MFRPLLNFRAHHGIAARAMLVAGFVLGGWCASPSLLRGQPPSVSWWETETAMDQHGCLLLSNKPWWNRAKALKVGEHFVVRSQYPGGGLMLVRRERVTRAGGRKADAIVWVIDDDGDMRPDAIDGDKKNDCYVVDYDGDGKVDRMVAYIDTDGDGKPDEMEIRYFQDGQLRIAWFGIDLDRRGRTWNLAGYEYSGDFFRSYPYGNALIYANKYDPEQKRWWPISECPFAFFDTQGQGQSEAVVRVSAVPLSFDPQEEPDMGNSAFSAAEPFRPRLRNIGAVNVRYSIDLDGLRSPERPLHYDLGFNLIGRVPYQFPGMARETPRRRTPKTTFCLSHVDTRRLAETYPAEQTGFSWREFADATLPLGDRPHAEEGRRWEGVFWTWSRRIMHDTGGPAQDWNVRREFRPAPSTTRELYYCRADHRIHLKGATEGWIVVGHLSGRDTWGEIRMFDTNGDGYFDRWETYLAGNPNPARVSTPGDAGIRDLPHDWKMLQQLYRQELAPQAIRADQELMAAMQPMADFVPPQSLTKALPAATCDSERGYLLDVIRETQYLALHAKLARRSHELLAAVSLRDTRRSVQERAASESAWAYARTLSQLDAAYGEGRYDTVSELLRALAKLDARPAAGKSRP
jgi:hypothetical protein